MAHSLLVLGILCLFFSLMVRNAQSLSCYECNSLMSVGCDNPANSGSYFYNFCGNDFQFCVQKITTDTENVSTYMERGCAEECGEESVVNYDRETKTSICCQTDGCNNLVHMSYDIWTVFLSFLFAFISLFYVIPA